MAIRNITRNFFKGNIYRGRSEKIPEGVFGLRETKTTTAASKPQIQEEQKVTTKADDWKEYFSYYDSKTGIYSHPMLAINRHDLIRQITNLLKNPDQKNNPLLLNAEDYAIFKVGDFNSSTGQIRGHAPEHIANLHEIRALLVRSEAEAQGYPAPMASLGQ